MLTHVTACDHKLWFGNQTIIFMKTSLYYLLTEKKRRKKKEVIWFGRSLFCGSFTSTTHKQVLLLFLLLLLLFYYYLFSVTSCFPLFALKLNQDINCGCGIFKFLDMYWNISYFSVVGAFFKPKAIDAIVDWLRSDRLDSGLE